jgi:hypothetical protein
MRAGSAHYDNRSCDQRQNSNPMGERHDFRARFLPDAILIMLSLYPGEPAANYYDRLGYLSAPVQLRTDVCRVALVP